MVSRKNSALARSALSGSASIATPAESEDGAGDVLNHLEPGKLLIVQNFFKKTCVILLFFLFQDLFCLSNMRIDPVCLSDAIIIVEQKLFICSSYRLKISYSH